MSKTVYVEEDVCIGCTLCTQMCPKTFAMNDNGKSYVINPTGDSENNVKQAASSCPVNCIKFKDK